VDFPTLGRPTIPRLKLTGSKSRAQRHGNEHGGQGAPSMLTVSVEEMLTGANVAFNMYPGLAFGAAEALAECATEEQKHKYVEKMINGTWGGTMCLTEPHAGSDVGSATTSAKKNADGTYSIRGTKIYISGGDHDLADNIIHLVLARVEGAPAGTKGLSLFIVPKYRIQADGSRGRPNDVQVASIEHKMGLNGSATCVLNFGEDGQCMGELVGTVENMGISQMFRMMNSARIAVGVQGLSVTASAYYNAVEYAKDRKQGAHYTQWKDPAAPRVSIIQHPDIRRMLLELKATTEGMRALVVKLAMHNDFARQLATVDPDKAAYHKGQVELLTPLVKGYNSEEAYRLCGQAIQVYGGAGYLKDYPVEQYARDSKIFTIYEGTTHIQAMDLVARKLGQAGGTYFQQFLGDVASFVETHSSHPVLGAQVAVLGKAQESLIQAAMSFLGWSQEGKTHRVALVANRFLFLMSQVAVGWLLLDAAVRSVAKLENMPSSHEDYAFYEGKKHSAIWYAKNVVALVEPTIATLIDPDDSAM
ncbi:MAG: acyl-CoA dehydrogenase, partial [Proteobacteria bacterium]|nr:acyl-CoA dehydrogenase [Pseudomonadota bacterium]